MVEFGALEGGEGHAFRYLLISSYVSLSSLLAVSGSNLISVAWYRQLSTMHTKLFRTQYRHSCSELWCQVAKCG